jgi:hypothetical protein
MQTPDDEELAIEQLPASRASEPELRHAARGRVLRESAAELSDPPIPERSTMQAFKQACQRADALEAQLQALDTPEVGRLASAERREQELILHRQELSAKERPVLRTLTAAARPT